MHTDGSCRPNPGYGGYYVIVEEWGDDHFIPLNTTTLTGRKIETTSQEIELLAIMAGLNFIANIVKEDAPEDVIVDVYSDSEWTIRCLQRVYNPTKYPKWFKLAHRLQSKMTIEYHHVESHQPKENAKFKEVRMNHTCHDGANNEREALLVSAKETGFWLDYL